MSPVEFLPLILGAATSLVSVSGLYEFITRRIKRKTERVEKEVIDALGISTPKPGDDKEDRHDFSELFRSIFERSRPDTASDHDGLPQERQDARTTSGGHSSQNIVVNVRNDSEAAGALAEIARRQSDGHARLIVKYYAQGHQQAFATFISSMIFGVIGFGVVVAACVYLLAHPKEPEPAAISGAVGLATQGVGYLFFRRADKARGLMLELIDKLRDDREKETRFIAGMLAVEGINSVVLRDSVRAATALQHSGSPFAPDQLATISQIILAGGNAAAASTPAIYINPLNNGNAAWRASEDQASAPGTTSPETNNTEPSNGKKPEGESAVRPSNA